MKNIQAVSIWDNGQTKQAKILNTYAVNVSLDHSATFWYGLLTKNENNIQGEVVAQGNLTMTSQEYDLWNDDDYAWTWVAEKLGLTITGEYSAPVEEPTQE